jgi:hypothetical protein
MSNTTLWFVYLTLEQGTPTVLVSDRPLSVPALESRRIRSITPKAAGRRYVRNNLETALAAHAKRVARPNDPGGSEELAPWVAMHRGVRNRAEVKVLREPVRAPKAPRAAKLPRGRKGRL